MGFWIFMFLMELIMPLTMIGFGRYFLKQAPKEINGGFGYRTRRSMKNSATWEFAHKYIGKLWYICGLILLPISMISMLCLIGKNEDIVGNFGGILCLVQLIPCIGAIFLTENALKKQFDEHGNER